MPAAAFLLDFRKADGSANMDVLDAIYHRRAIRAFTSEAVEKEVIESLVDAAVHAPNALDKQRWAFVIVRDRGLMRRISTEAKALTLKTIGSNPDLKPFADMLSSPDLNIFYDAPVLVIICATQDDRFVEQDCCLAAQNLLLAACAKGLGTCWIGFAEAWLNRPEAKKELGIPATFRPIAPVILGYPRTRPNAPERHRPDMIWIES